MPNILKQFSIEDDSPKVEKKPQPEKSETKDFLKQKYVTSAPRIEPAPVVHHHKPAKKPSSSATPHVLSTFSARNYLWQLPTLLLALICYFGCYLILKNVQPSAIQNTWLPNSYLPLLLIAAVGHFFAAWYLLQNTRRGLILAIALTMLLYLRIHHQWTVQWLAIVLIPLFVLELLLTYRSFRR